MTMLSEGTAGYPWGLLVVSDERSDFQDLPPQFAEGEGAAVGADAVAYRVQNLHIGDATVRVWRDAMNGDRSPDVTVRISVPSGRLVVGDVERSEDVTTVVDLEPGSYTIDAYFDAPFAPKRWIWC